MSLDATVGNFDAIMAEMDAGAPAAPPPAQPQQQQPATQQQPQAQQPSADPRAQQQQPDPEPQFDENGNPIDEGPAEPEVALDDVQLAQQARAWLEGEPVPAEMLPKLSLVAPDGTVVTADEAINNFTRRGLLTQKEQAAAQTRQHFEMLVSRQRQQWEGWGNDDARMEVELEDMGFGPQLESIARRKVNQYAQEQRILERLVVRDPQTGQMVPDRQARQQMEQVFADRRRASLEARQAQKRAQYAQMQAQQHQGNSAHDQNVQRVAHQMAQFGPRALREVGIGKPTPYVRHLVSQEMSRMHRPGTPLTYEMVLEAARNAKDLIALDRDNAMAQRTEANPRRRAALPRGTSNPRVGDAPHPQTTQQNRARLSDFDAEMAALDRRGI